jgi:hypothetical protein
VRLIVNVIALVILRASSFDGAQDDITALRMTWLKMGSGRRSGRPACGGVVLCAMKWGGLRRQ